MRARIMSDLHLHNITLDGGFKFVDAGEDVCILAGDIGEGRHGVEWALRNIPEHIRVLYVPGNHEYYGQEYFRLNNWFRDHNKRNTHVRVLLNESEIWGGVKFVGCTLWTDFKLYGTQDLSALCWKDGLNDSRWITYSDRKFQINDMLELNAQAIEYLWKERGDVLITHYCPHTSVAPQYQGDRLTPGFATKIPEGIWCNYKTHIHGHTHSPMYYKIAEGFPEVICNPRGHHGENRRFNPNMLFHFGENND